jgi:hypothetical protein
MKPLKMDLTEGSETSANIKQTLGKHPKVNTVNEVIWFQIRSENVHVFHTRKDIKEGRNMACEIQPTTFFEHTAESANEAQSKGSRSSI